MVTKLNHKQNKNKIKSKHIIYINYDTLCCTSRGDKRVINSVFAGKRNAYPALIFS